MINTVLFDLDGTLLPMDLEEFIKYYFGALSKKFMESKWDDKLLVKGISEGTKAMIVNDGRVTNEELFWKVFEDVTKIKRESIEAEFMSFYLNEFASLGNHMIYSENMVKAIELLKKKGYRLLLTTNPLFPQIAVRERLRWAHLNPEDFEIRTSFEDYYSCKPNVSYFKEVIANANLNVDECMMVGNDSLEDGIVESLGIPLYLVTDYLIHRDDTPLKSKWHGSSSEFLAFVSDLPELNKLD